MMNTCGITKEFCREYTDDIKNGNFLYLFHIQNPQPVTHTICHKASSHQIRNSNPYG